MSEFDPVLNVSRQSVIGDLMARIGAVEGRFVSVVGAAGIGKTWVMADVFLQMANLPEDRKVLPFWLSVTVGSHYPGTEDVVPDCSGENGRIQWLKSAMAKINQVLGQQKITYDNTFNFDVNFDAFCQTICEEMPGWCPVLFFDGYDDLNASETDYWQEKIAQFWSPQCTLAFLGRRDHKRIDHPVLEWDEEIVVLQPFVDEQRDEQITKKGQALPTPPNPTPPAQVLDGYTTGNPFINAWLFDYVVQHHISSINRAELEACLDAYLMRANVSVFSRNLVIQLGQELSSVWTTSDLETLAPQIKIDDPPMKPLFANGVVCHIKNTPRYKLDDGLYELIQMI